MATISEAAAELKSIARSLEEAPVRAHADMRTVTSAIGHRVEGQAKIYVPVDTGNLRNSIDTIVTEAGETVTADVGTEVDYAYYVEFGTRNMLPQPYLGPALDMYEEDYAHALGVIIVPGAFR